MAGLSFRATWGMGLALLALAGCNVIFGLEEGQPRPPTNGGGSGGVAGGAVGGSGGLGGSTTSGGSGGGSVGGGGSGGTNPGPCDLFSPGVCGAGQKCSIVNESTGQTGCVSAGPRPAWAACDFDEQCVEGLWCDHLAEVCKPLCQTSAQCPTGADCLAANASGGGAIPGLEICTAHCDPLSSTSCNQLYGPTSCIWLGPIDFDCWTSGNVSEQQACSEPAECAPGLVCAGDGMEFRCFPWCAVGVDPCGPITNCAAFDPALYYDGTQVGLCG